MGLPKHDDRLVDGQRIAHVLRQDEDERFDAYFREAFPGEVPADQQVPSHILTEAGAHPMPQAAEPDTDVEPDTHAGVRRTASDDVLENKVIAAYVRSYFPGATP
jgi:hypothetical protein